MKEFNFKINGTDYSANIKEVEGNEITVEVNGTPYKVTVDKQLRPSPKAVQQPTPIAKPTPAAAATVAAAPKAAPSAVGTKIATPLPGTILAVYVAVGDTVKPGQVVVNLEAMKMENAIESDVAGTVKAVNVRQGDSVLEDDVLVVIG